MEHKTYDHAMMRCLGWPRHHIVVLTAVRSMALWIFPALGVGCGLAFALKETLRLYASGSMKLELVLEFNEATLWVGICSATVLPFLAILGPIHESLAVQLRDALDIHRQKASVLTVQFKKLEDQYGLSHTQF